ncbi:TRAPP subunit [Coemansia sp. RSA 989]|nr:Sedlin [Coemansia mojavensis]KAJ1742885.1 TRAPP subunit [Coemansia sp. RSA 1086]KAJ1749417.1 TRAPP subunit [Coemansia sp. RSA 1821]KAJ1866056.1 TRAPP subunit [Coemansia sp. RSA 989]KAJ1873284.1 TRAPP subunit [Coemansia sp. RSA 990]KAJ2648165.1 TRAPP subunit [Coemansia sp. RSA 1250]KAJ2669961.1 TRAPP subunit [Coemansia sp. RSA 1085]
MSVTYYFAIVGTADSPLYEAEFGVQRNENKHLHQFVVHAALDLVEDALFANNSCYLKTIDTYQNLNVSAYVTPSNVRLMLVHEAKSEEAIRAFFAGCHELFVRTLLNPFYDPSMPIQSRAFDAKVNALAKKFLI